MQERINNRTSRNTFIQQQEMMRVHTGLCVYVQVYIIQRTHCDVSTPHFPHAWLKLFLCLMWWKEGEKATWISDFPALSHFLAPIRCVMICL